MLDLDELHILKITFRNGLYDRYGEFPTAFPTRFATEFPARISRKNFPQDLPARFSCKNFPQDFPARCSQALAWLFGSPSPYSKCKIPPITAFLKLAFSPPCPARISRKIFPQEFPTRFSHKNFPQDFPKLDPDWLAPHHPIPNAKFPPITALLNRSTYHKSSKVSPPPFPQILWEPQINE